MAGNTSNTVLSIDGLNFTTLKLTLAEHIFTITLNRPHKKNAFNRILLNELLYALRYAKQTRDIRVVVLTGVGDVFCAGADLKTWQGDGREVESTVPFTGEKDDPSDEMALALYELHKPVITHLSGSVYAGALLMVCNATHAIAADHVVFAAPEIKRGIWPFKVMAGLFNVMGQRAGLDFIMRGERMDAATAVSTGLINAAVPAGQLAEQVQRLATALAQQAPGTMQLGLAAFRAQQSMDFATSLRYLTTQLEHCLQTADAKEGIAAFVEKREPNWD